tara:strand:- start:112 stop:912 length:801 start_codon:yes stop_codon:yes gene_type:complete
MRANAPVKYSESLFVYKWRRALLLPDVSVPDDAERCYKNSKEWEDCALVLRDDYKRRPPYASAVSWRCVHDTMLRFSVLNRSDRYIQGFLYIMLPLASVLPASKVLGGLIEIVGALRPYGPTAGDIAEYERHQVCVARRVGNEARALTARRGRHASVQLTQGIVSCPAFRHMLSLRWLFVIFGQAPQERSALIGIWDFCLHDLVHGHQRCLHALAAHMIADWVCEHAGAHSVDDAEEALGLLFEHKWSAADVARVLRAVPRRGTAL